MLVLSDTYRLRIYLHQLGKRVHQPPAYGRAASDGQVQIRKFLARNVGCRIDPRAAFIHHHDLNIFRQPYSLDKGFSLPACSSITDGNSVDAKAAAEVAYFCGGLANALIREMRINRVVMEELGRPLLV